MAAITPTPRQGSVLATPNWAGPWTAQPRQGSVLVCDLIPIKPGFRHVGLVRGARG